MKTKINGLEKKVKDILGSVRFWIVTLGWVLFVLQGVEADTYSFSLLLDGITGWLGTVAGIGTLDSIATKISLK